ncbi:Uncharacterised protein [Mycobacterium tuberculosis]|nr:Uncharacterised protein [Mycobacterium tuberculosis]
MGVAVRQTVATGHHVVAARDQTRQPGMWSHTRVDDSDLHTVAAAELPSLVQVQHLHIFWLQLKVGAGQDPDLGAVGVLLHGRQRSGRPVGWQRARIDRRRRNCIRWRKAGQRARS